MLALGARTKNLVVINWMLAVGTQFSVKFLVYYLSLQRGSRDPVGYSAPSVLHGVAIPGPCRLSVARCNACEALAALHHPLS